MVIYKNETSGGSIAMVPPKSNTVVLRVDNYSRYHLNVKLPHYVRSTCRDTHPMLHAALEADPGCLAVFFGEPTAVNSWRPCMYIPLVKNAVAVGGDSVR